MIMDSSNNSFERQLSVILDKVDPNKSYSRKDLSLDLNYIISAGQYGEIIGGKLGTKPCEVHVVSGMC